MPAPKKTALDPRSEVLFLLDKLSTQPLTDAEIRRIKRVIQRSWGDPSLPKRKVRIWWGPTDQIVHASSPGEAVDLALSAAPVPIPVRIMVFTEDKDGAWDPEADRTL